VEACAWPGLSNNFAKQHHELGIDLCLGHGFKAVSLNLYFFRKQAGDDSGVDGGVFLADPLDCGRSMPCRLRCRAFQKSSDPNLFASIDYLVRAQQNGCRDFNSDRLRGSAVHDQLYTRRLFDRDVAGFRASKYFIHENWRTAEHLREVYS
jgi:hypothetical protein